MFIGCICGGTVELAVVGIAGLVSLASIAFDHLKVKKCQCKKTEQACHIVEEEPLEPEDKP